MDKLFSLDDYRMNESAGFLLCMASNAIDRKLAEEVKKKCPGLTAAQWKILMLIGNDKCKNAAELAGVMNCDMASITRLLDRLEAKGLVQRRRSTVDRRLVDISLTDRGQELVPRLPEAPVEMMKRMFRDFSKEEIDQLNRFLRRIISAERNPK